MIGAILTSFHFIISDAECLFNGLSSLETNDDTQTSNNLKYLFNFRRIGVHSENIRNLTPF